MSAFIRQAGEAEAKGFSLKFSFNDTAESYGRKPSKGVAIVTLNMSGLSYLSVDQTRGGNYLLDFDAFETTVAEVFVFRQGSVKLG